MRSRLTPGIGGAHRRLRITDRLIARRCMPLLDGDSRHRYLFYQAQLLNLPDLIKILYRFSVAREQSLPISSGWRRATNRATQKISPIPVRKEDYVHADER